MSRRPSVRHAPGPSLSQIRVPAPVLPILRYPLPLAPSVCRLALPYAAQTGGHAIPIRAVDRKQIRQHAADISQAEKRKPWLQDKENQVHTKAGERNQQILMRGSLLAHREKALVPLDSNALHPHL